MKITLNKSMEATRKLAPHLNVEKKKENNMETGNKGLTLICIVWLIALTGLVIKSRSDVRLYTISRSDNETLMATQNEEMLDKIQGLESEIETIKTTLVEISKQDDIEQLDDTEQYVEISEELPAPKIKTKQEKLNDLKARLYANRHWVSNTGAKMEAKFMGYGNEWIMFNSPRYGIIYTRIDDLTPQHRDIVIKIRDSFSDANSSIDRKALEVEEARKNSTKTVQKSTSKSKKRSTSLKGPTYHSKGVTHPWYTGWDQVNH